ncbi:MAG: alpha/beta fold hydrolase [Candidatus Sulfotelmatobacter sp.]
MNRATIIELLTPIWQRVLQRPSVKLNDNFFGLGGNPSSAVKLFTEIAESFGRRLPPVLIYAAPTIGALAGLLEEPAPPRVPSLLLLKAGVEQPPVFIAHGIGGTVFDFFNLVQKMKSSHPIYGMQSRGADGVDEPLTSIEAMAQFHLDAIKQLQPRGPYFLIGYSLGGLVTLEIAQRLTAFGEKVALLVFVDTYPHKSKLTPKQRRYLTVRWAKRRVRLLIEKARRRNRSNTAKEAGRGASLGRNPAWLADPAMRRLREAENLAWERYHPRYYSGKIKFVKAEISTDFPDDPVAIWSRFAETFEIETAPGDHLGMLTTEFEKLGLVLTRYLDDASPVTL